PRPPRASQMPQQAADRHPPAPCSRAELLSSAFHSPAFLYTLGESLLIAASRCEASDLANVAVRWCRSRQTTMSSLIAGQTSSLHISEFISTRVISARESDASKIESGIRLAIAAGVAQSSTAARGLLRQSGTLSSIHGVSAITTTRMPKSRRAFHRLASPSASFRSLSADELEPNAVWPLD